MPKLFLIPNSIVEGDDKNLLSSNTERIAHVRLFFVEEAKSARRLLKMMGTGFPLQECRFLDLNEHTTPSQLKEYALFLKEDAGIISESGCPAVADPGAELVALAHKAGVGVVPLVGPSSILLALMASGLNGQNFAFNGYLPKETVARHKKIKLLQERALQEGQSQIFMETPYRNAALLDEVLKLCREDLMLSLSCDIYGKEEMILTKSIKQWKNLPPQLPKKPALFIINKSL